MTSCADIQRKKQTGRLHARRVCPAPLPRDPALHGTRGVFEGLLESRACKGEQRRVGAQRALCGLLRHAGAADAAGGLCGGGQR